MTSISLHAGKRKANENWFWPSIVTAAEVAKGGAAGSSFIVTLITPQATEVMLMLESHGAEGFLSKQAAPVLQ